MQNMSSTPTEIITLCTLKGDEPNDSLVSSDIDESEKHQEDNIKDDSKIILCIIYKVGKLGAAYYNFTDKQLYVYEELLENGPQYLIIEGLMREIKPKFVLTIGGRTDEFVKAIIDIINYGCSFQNNTTSDSVQSIPENLFLVPLHEYTYEICKAIISQLNLAAIKDEQAETKRELYINSLINFDNRLSLQAIGSLVKFLEKNWSFFGIADKTDLTYIHINQVCRKDRVLIDNSTFKALQIFSKRGHEAGFKRGEQSSNREGLSVFKLFSVHCKSKIGLMTLKNILLNPIRNIDVLNQRLDFISFVLEPSNREFIQSLRDHLQGIVGDTNVILTRIQNSQAKVRDWKVLYETIYHMNCIRELSSPYRERCSLFLELDEIIPPNLMGLEESIKNGLDFKASKQHGKPSIRYGLDESLDAKMLRRQDIINDVMAAARFAAENLPDFLDECSVVYLPEMGHLLAVKEWEKDCRPEDLQYLGFRFMFKIGGKILYKNPMCVELDNRLGDIVSEIIDHENRIIRRLTGFIMKYNKDITEPLKTIGMIDSLIAMALTATSRMYKRPLLNKQNYFILEGCRHPLMEHLLTQFQSNDFFSGGQFSRMKIITGPNGSGKTVYLKQISLTIYLAHVGSYVPCSNADIGMLDSMYSRLCATESAAVRLSSFMINATQMTHALTASSSSSLILMDEFGKGTSVQESIGFLEGVLKHFLDKRNNCPHVLVSTHCQSIHTRIPQTPMIQYQKMLYTKENGVLYFLYKITEGVSNSFAIEVAEAIGIDAQIIRRAKEYYRCLTNKEAISPLDKLLRRNAPTNIDVLNIPDLDDDTL